MQQNLAFNSFSLIFIKMLQICALGCKQLLINLLYFFKVKISRIIGKMYMSIIDVINCWSGHISIQNNKYTFRASQYLYNNPRNCLLKGFMRPIILQLFDIKNTIMSHQKLGLQQNNIMSELSKVNFHADYGLKIRRFVVTIIFVANPMLFLCKPNAIPILRWVR